MADEQGRPPAEAGPSRLTYAGIVRSGPGPSTSAGAVRSGGSGPSTSEAAVRSGGTGAVRSGGTGPSTSAGTGPSTSAGAVRSGGTGAVRSGETGPSTSAVAVRSGGTGAVRSGGTGPSTSAGAGRSGVSGPSTSAGAGVTGPSTSAGAVRSGGTGAVRSGGIGAVRSGGTGPSTSAVAVRSGGTGPSTSGGAVRSGVAGPSTSAAAVRSRGTGASPSGGSGSSTNAGAVRSGGSGSSSISYAGAVRSAGAGSSTGSYAGAVRSVARPSISTTSTAPSFDGLTLNTQHTRPPRPDPSKAPFGGISGTVFANHFLVTQLPNATTIYQYDVKIEDINNNNTNANQKGNRRRPNQRPPIRSKCRAIKKALEERHRGVFRGRDGAYAAYDGSQTLYTTAELPLLNPDRGFQVVLPGPEQESYRVYVKESKRIELQGTYSLDGSGIIPADNFPQDLLQALDVAMRECMASNDTFFEHGRLFFKEPENAQRVDRYLGGYVQYWDGFYQSLKNTRQGLALNVNKAVAAFYVATFCVDTATKQIAGTANNPPTVAAFLIQNKYDEKMDNAELLSRLRGAIVRVTSSENILSKKRYRIESFQKKPAEELFTPQGSSQKKSVAEHFHGSNRPLRYPELPCVKLQTGPPKVMVVPPEYCTIVTPQHVHITTDKNHRTKLAGEVLTKAASGPEETKTAIDNLMTNVPLVEPVQGRLNNNVVAPPRPGSTPHGFEMTVSSSMTEVTGKLLDSPRLKSFKMGHHHGKPPPVEPVDGKWKITDTNVARMGKIGNWGFVLFKPISLLQKDFSKAFKKFQTDLAVRCKELGVHLPAERQAVPAFIDFELLDNYEGLCKKLKDTKVMTEHRLEKRKLLIFVFWKQSIRGYQFVKHICECHLGVISQCCKFGTIEASPNQFLWNLALKINVKAGGTTTCLERSPLLREGVGADTSQDEACIVMGADTSHAGTGGDPAVTAVVASLTYPDLDSYAARIRLQRPRVELIKDFRSIAIELLNLYKVKNATSKRVTRVIMFRDGVSEGQFADMLSEEVDSLRAALVDVFSSLSGERPKITWVVVQKRHQTKLFTEAPELTMDPNNIKPELQHSLKPGLMVDEKITHPADFDFFLCSHPAVKGTSKPTHYHVLYDENDFGALELPTLVNRLCYTYARCTSAVSIPAPTFYAHHAAVHGHQLYTAFKKRGELHPQQLTDENPTLDLSAQMHRDIRDTMFFV